MKITCMSCQRFEFEIDLSPSELKKTPVVALTCPECGKSTAVQERPGGGIEISLDKHLEKSRGK
jgi:uncharacterized protein YlaI